MYATPVNVTRTAAGNWQIEGANGDRAELLLIGNSYWLLPVGCRSTDLAWDGWQTSEAEALGHAVACLAWS